MHTYESIPSYLNHFSFSNITIPYFVSLVLFKTYMLTLFNILQLMNYSKVYRSYLTSFNDKTKIATNKFLELFYLDKSIFVRYFYTVLLEVNYAIWINTKRK